MAALIQTFGEATQHSWPSTPKERNLRKPKAMPASELCWPACGRDPEVS